MKVKRRGYCQVKVQSELGGEWIERKETSVSEMIKVKSLCQCLLIEVLIKMREWCKLR